VRLSRVGTPLQKGLCFLVSLTEFAALDTIGNELPGGYDAIWI
jgi:hypothetical protein